MLQEQGGVASSSSFHIVPGLDNTPLTVLGFHPDNNQLINFRGEYIPAWGQVPSFLLSIAKNIIRTHYVRNWSSSSFISVLTYLDKSCQSILV